DPERLAVVDAAPGTSCPVVEAVKGTDFCILVTEPTPFGLNDLKLAVEMTEELGVPVGVVINRADIGYGRVEEFCEAKGIPVLMRIPFRREIAEAYSEGLPLVEAFPEYREKFAELIEKIGEVR
ncbi:MAG TPA: (4Fe-4S)-binding protein, partial [Candidatus Latescibacteria bacterium]|nr:(4Fe-4S)-binding protein [Candidatus Latescibacterota bacterium]